MLIHVRLSRALTPAEEVSNADQIVSSGLDDEITNYGLTIPQ